MISTERDVEFEKSPYTVELENALRNLLECFEPSVPTMFEGYGADGETVFVEVPEEVEDVIAEAEELLCRGVEESE